MFDNNFGILYFITEFKSDIKLMIDNIFTYSFYCD